MNSETGTLEVGKLKHHHPKVIISHTPYKLNYVQKYSTDPGIEPRRFNISLSRECPTA